MKEFDNCLRQVAKVRSVARQEEVAYVARSRLGRLVLAVADLVGSILNIRVEDRPARLPIPTSAPLDVEVLVEICNSLLDTTKTLVQPSEPLDERWRSGWSVLMADLDRMEYQLQMLQARDRATQ